MNTISKSLLSIAAAITVVGATITPAFVQAWGDNANGRPSYTIAEVNAGKLGDKITFNSIKDSKIGDEKNFVGAKAKGRIGTWNANEINVEDGKTYTIRLYVHNNSPKGASAVAKDVKANFSLPTTVANYHTVIGYLNSSNATPSRYWDEVTFKSNQDFYLEYLEGSAKYSNAKLGTVNLPNEIITSGATLGYEALDGKIPGCFEYDGVVTIDVKVHYSVNSKLAKTVRKKGAKTWSETVDAKVGDEVEFEIAYTNLTNQVAKNVMIRDALPANLEYVKDSTVLYNANYKSGVKIKDNTITTTGINIGDYSHKGNAYVRFTAKVVDQALTCGNNKLVNWASSTVNSKVTKDDASVNVSKTCNPSPNPTPDTIVETGAGGILIGALGLGSVATALGFYIASLKKF